MSRRHPFEHPADADVLVDLRPAYSVTFVENLVLATLLRSRVGQAPGPRERNADRAPVREPGGDHLVGHLNRLNTRFVTSFCRSAHAMPPRFGAAIRRY